MNTSRPLFALFVLSFLACDALAKHEPRPEPRPVAHPPIVDLGSAPWRDIGAPVAETADKLVVPKIDLSKAPADIAKGKGLFADRGCIACHKIGGGKLIGPDLKGVTKRRDVTWIEKMVLHPEVMEATDPVAKQLLVVHQVPMPNQSVDPKADLPYLLSYLKSAE
jgi:cytochrome c551/c552